MNELKLRFIIILNAAWRQRYVIVLPMLIMPFAGYFVGKMAPEKYVSHTSMLIQETAKNEPVSGRYRSFNHAQGAFGSSEYIAQESTYFKIRCQRAWTD